MAIEQDSGQAVWILSSVFSTFHCAAYEKESETLWGGKVGRNF